jgi:hypothetical protein
MDSALIDVRTFPSFVVYVVGFPITAMNSGGVVLASTCAASGWYFPAVTKNVPVGSTMRLRQNLSLASHVFLFRQRAHDEYPVDFCTRRGDDVLRRVLIASFLDLEV